MVNITKFAVKRPVTIVLCLITIAYFGLQSLLGTKIELTPEMERYEEIGHLLEAYPKFADLDEKYVEPDSLIREFIGGGIYDD